MLTNTLGDLNDYLFESLERLSDDSLEEYKLELEIRRSKAIANTAMQIISNGNLVLRAKIMQEEYDNKDPLPPMLTSNE